MLAETFPNEFNNNGIRIDQYAIHDNFKSSTAPSQKNVRSLSHSGDPDDSCGPQATLWLPRAYQEYVIFTILCISA